MIDQCAAIIKLEKLRLNHIWLATKNELKKSCNQLLAEDINDKLKTLSRVINDLLDLGFDLDEHVVDHNLSYDLQQLVQFLSNSIDFYAM